MQLTSGNTYRLPQAPQAARRIKMGVQKHFTGSLVVGDDEGQEMEVESHTEMQTALVVLARRDTVALENQVPFEWADADDKPRVHYFDFRVSHRNGTRTMLVVKNSKTAAKPEFRSEIGRLAGQVTPDVADRVCLITERHLDPIEVHNAELIHSVRQQDPEPEVAIRKVVAKLTGAARIGDLVDAAGYGGRGFRSIVRLIRMGELELISHERIAPNATVRRRAI